MAVALFSEELMESKGSLRKGGSGLGPSGHELLFFFFAVLLPFSKGIEVAVVTYAAPVMLILGLFYITRFATLPELPGGITGGVLLFGILQIGWMILLCIPGERNYIRAVRVLPHIFGWLVLFYMTSEIVMRDRIRAKTRAMQWTGIFVLSAGILALYYIVNIALGAAEFGLAAVLAERFVSGLASLPWGASNTVASTLLFGYVVCVVAFVQNSAESQLKFGRVFGANYAHFLAFMLVVIASGIIATISRNGIATMVLASLPLITRKWLRPALALGILSVGLFVFVSLNQELALGIFEERTASDSVGTYNNRQDFWAVFASYWFENPLAPIGFYNCLFHFGFSSHNILLTTLVEQSVVATGMLFVTWLLLFLGAIRLYKSKKRSVRKAGLAFLFGCAAIVLNSNFEDPQYTQQYVVFMWVWMACLLVQVELSAPSLEPKIFGHQIQFRRRDVAL